MSHTNAGRGLPSVSPWLDGWLVGTRKAYIMLNFHFFRRQLKKIIIPTARESNKIKNQVVAGNELMLKNKNFSVRSALASYKGKASLTITDENKRNVIEIGYWSPMRYKICIEI